ncbi:MAG TPA: LamG-like jellyroll fold domain-containing protein [Candidatus Baltobacteraceae bacterium]|nr:LamG-like jellyroll fold domain-containing protein [Candidatus Baltobacteraceae bacterium]
MTAILTGCGGSGGSGRPGALPMTARQATGTGTASSYDAVILGDNPAEYYRLDENTGTVAADSSSHGAAATYVGNGGTDYNLAQSPGPIASETAGWLEDLGTTASHGVMAPGVAAASTTSSWTAEAWVKLTALPSEYETILGNSGQNRLLITHAGALLYQNHAGVPLTSATLLQPGTLYHIVLRSDLSAGTYGVVSFFVNGVKDANTLSYASANYRQGMNATYYWGQYDASIWYKFNGYLGRVAYYTSALSDTQVAAHYSAGSSVASLPQPTPSPVATPTASPAATITAPSGISSFTGQIYSNAAGRISIDPRPYCGYQNIATNSSTIVFNGPVSNTWAVFTGTGAACSTSFVARSVTLYSAAPGSSTASGTVSGATSYGFTLTTSNGAAVPVLLTSSTAIFGGQLTTGSNVSVTGVGSASGTIAATQVAVAAATPDPNVSPTATPGPITTTHVLTAGFIYGYSGTPTTVPLSSIAPWISWAETDSLHAAMLRSAGIKVTAYNAWWRNYTIDNPNSGYVDLAPGGAHASAEAVDCSGNAIKDPNYGTGYIADARNAGALGHAQLVLNYRLKEFGSNYDAMFSDQTGSVSGITPPCNYSQPTFDAAVNAVHQALGVNIIINALGAFTNPASAVDLTNPSNVIGAMCEECYGRNGGSGDSIETGVSWQNVENAEILMMAKQKLFWDYARLSGDPTTETAYRTYAYASFLLGYDPGYAMFDEALTTNSGFPVMPEVGLVPMQPVTTASSVAGYAAQGGAYFREFAACYYKGAFVARCAVVVNPSTTSTVPVPSTSYTHSMTLAGSGVLDGGTVSFNGPQVSQLAPGTAAILLP